VPESVPDGFISEDQLVADALKLWNHFKKYIIDFPKFKELSDKRKLETFRKMGYTLFMEEYPIVSRYMICMGQFSIKAFRRVLAKIKTFVHPPPDKREKGYMEDQWIRRQADYVQYLWEAYQKNHYNNAERKYIYEQAYKSLKGEFDDFRTMHDDIKIKVEEEKQSLAGKNARELLERVKSGKQTPEDEIEVKNILLELSIITNKKAYNNVLKQLLTVVKLQKHNCYGVGEGAEMGKKITMIETVDANRMNEIDDRYKSAEDKSTNFDNQIQVEE
jgi:hypothetical protein